MIIESLRSLATPIENLKALPGNPRKGDVDAVAKSLERFGQRKPIVARKDDGTIIAGNHTWQAAKKLGWNEIAVAFVGDDDVTAKAYALADNRTAELGSYDEQALIDLIEEVHAVVPEFVRDAGWSDDAIAELVAKIESEQPLKEIDEDEIPEPPVEPITKLGDIWQLGRHRLMCGDSTDEIQVTKLMNGEKADMVFTDPPYGVSYTGGLQFKDGVVEKNNREMIKNDDVDIYEDVFKMLSKFSNGPCYVWFAGTKASSLYVAAEEYGDIHALIIWVKNGGYGALNANYKQKHEPCIYWKPKGKTLNFIGPTTETTIWEINKDGRNDLHPTQKPVALPSKAIQNHNAKTILDLFGGSGSTLIAAEQTDRTCYMMELDPKYCDVIIKRWENLTGEKAVLVPNAESA
jgi:site-specific DNA-methyltransferase (adenine-specific)